ncbi:MAG: chorismate mutase [Euryarchaeota archaeon]|nr:chorismate mutase [Euryarchaeota archaeon]
MDRSDALKILEESRDQIERIDKAIINLIKMRIKLARDIADVKIFLGLEIEDKKREDYILDKTGRIAEKEKIDKESVKEIMKILTNLNKKEQEEIFRRKNNGKH